MFNTIRALWAVAQSLRGGARPVPFEQTVGEESLSRHIEALYAEEHDAIVWHMANGEVVADPDNPMLAAELRLLTPPWAAVVIGDVDVARVSLSDSQRENTELAHRKQWMEEVDVDVERTSVGMRISAVRVGTASPDDEDEGEDGGSLDSWRSGWDVSVRSDLGSSVYSWAFTSRADAREGVWTVSRRNDGALWVFSAKRGLGALPRPDEIAEMTRAAVAGLLATAGLADQHGWKARNLTAALLTASTSIDSWEGEEWALEAAPDDATAIWASPDAPRTPYAWLRARGEPSDTIINVYQDDAVFGLFFVPNDEFQVRETNGGSWRPRRDIPMVRGPVDTVAVAYDTAVQGPLEPGLVTEILIEAGSDSVLLIAAEAYSSEEWHLHDESVVALPSTAVADGLEWIPPRRHWHHLT